MIKRLCTLLIFLLPFFISAQTTATPYDYLSVNQIGFELKITRGTDRFETINVRREMNDDIHDYRPLFKRIREFEEDGWQVFNVTQSDNKAYYLLRRARQ